MATQEERTLEPIYIDNHYSGPVCMYERTTGKFQEVIRNEEMNGKVAKHPITVLKGM